MREIRGLGHDELQQLVQSDVFLSRVSVVGMQLAANNLEGGFALSRAGDAICYSPMLIPESFAENGDLDPAKALYVNDITLRANQGYNPAILATLHGHPTESDGAYDLAAALPSYGDICRLAQVEYPANPAHIGMVAHVEQAPAPHVQIQCFRAGNNFTPDELLAKPLDSMFFHDYHATLEAHGVRTASLRIMSDGRIFGLHNLEHLYED
ncbi:MAG TPA: hypothetical protein VJP80_04640 [Candidatus Saccharimonadales bacterium]|nr:hypothetical protein [Candidatus Saccharimonadales bacterium]